MSFILDALKKSENERQRQVGPSLADVRIGKGDPERPWWAVAVAALLVVNLGVLLVVLLRDDASDASPPGQSAPGSTATLPPAAASSALPTARIIPPANTASLSNPAVHPLADEASNGFDPPVDPSIASNPALASAANVPAGPPVVRPVEPPAVSPASTTATLQARSAPGEVLPTPMDLAASGKAVPELHLDIHVYSEKPADRFVFVNMHKYIEGQALNEGPTVERITTDGVVLNHRGLRFLLPRQ